MRKSLFALALLAGTAALPALAQVGIGVGGGADAGISGTLGGAGVGGGIGADVGAGVDAGAAGATVGTGSRIDTGAGLSVSERNAQAASLGLDLDAKSSTGLIGRTVIGADGEVLGKVRSVNTAGLDSVSSIGVGSSAASAVALDASQLATDASGRLVASGVSKTDLKGLPSADAGAQGSLIGQAVVGSDGQSIGTVENVVVDSSGSISQVLLKAKGSGRVVAIERTKLDTNGGQLTATNMTSSQFKAIAAN